MATRNWLGSTNNDLNNSSNYDGTGSLLSTDDLVFSSGNIAASGTANLTIQSLTMTSGYSGNFNLVNYTLTSSGNLWFSGTGTLGLGSGLVFNGPTSTGYFSAGLGAVTATNCILTFNGNNNYFVNKLAMTINSIVIGSNAKCLTNGSSALTVQSNTTCLTLGNNSIFTNESSIIIEFYALSTQTIMSFGSNTTWNGISTIYVGTKTAGITVSIPAITYTGTGSQFQYRVSSSSTINFIGNQNISATSIWITTLNNVTAIFNFGSYTFNFTNLNFYKDTANANNVTNLDTAIINCTSCIITTNYATTYNLLASTINCSGNFTYLPNNIINPGTSIVNITNTSTITSNSKAFYDFNVNTAASGTLVTFADSPRISGDFTVTQGSTNLDGLIWSGWGDILFDGTGNHTIGSGITLVNAGTFRLNTLLSSCVSAGCYVKCNDNASLNIGNRTINRLGLTSGKTYTWTAGIPTTRIATYTATDWDGSIWQSSTPGSRYYINSPASVTLSNANIKDCNNSAGTLITANNGTNTTGGNNLNINFMGTISILPITGTESGGTSIAISDTGNSFGGSFSATLDGVTCTSPTILTTQTGSCISPLHAPGIVDFVILTSDGETQTLTGGWTYTSNEPPYTPPTISGQLTEMRFYNPLLHTQYIAKGRRVLRAVQRYIGS